MNLIEKHSNLLDSAIKALSERNYFSPYPESPKAYAENGDSQAKAWFSAQLNTDFIFSDVKADKFIGEEISPYLQVGLGIKYPQLSISNIIDSSKKAQLLWSETPIALRAAILIESLENIKNKFFEIAYATMHTTGQSYMMSFQASGPHSNDRALEAIAMGYVELTRFPNEVLWSKNMGKFNLNIRKDWKAVSKGIGLVIGCSTFPVWNTLPGVFANLICGNTCIVKPHAKSVLPIAIALEEIRKTCLENNIDPNIVQAAIDSINQPITKELAEHSDINLIDYTGNSEFGSYLEKLPKTVFTEKAGVNNMILDSVDDLPAALGNIALSVSLYSGQMCTAPQNIFISQDGIKTKDGHLSFEEVKTLLVKAIQDLNENPKAGPAVLGSVQNELTTKRVEQMQLKKNNILKASGAIKNEEFPDSRSQSVLVLESDANQINEFNQECFGPIVFIIKTENTFESIRLAAKVAEEKGALTCGVYTTDEAITLKVTEIMNRLFIPVSFNFTGAALINSHAAFSDFHLTGGNRAGNASYCNPEFIIKRFVWVGNRYMA